MFRYIRNNIITIRQSIGLDIHFMEDDTMVISGVHLRATKGAVQKVKHLERIHTFKDLQTKLPKNIPVAVTLNGKGVLLRSNKGKASDNLINNLFPGANPQDFVYTVHDMEGVDSLVYVSRKSFAQQVVKDLTASGIRFISLTLGSGPVDVVRPFMHKWSIEVDTPTLSIGINDKKVLSVKQQPYDKATYNEIEIGEDRYRTNHMLALGSALSILSTPADRVHSDINASEISYLQKDFVYFKLFQFAGWAVLTTTLALLLINFFVFNSYFTKNKELTQSSDLSSVQSGDDLAENARLDSSYTFFMKSGWNKSSKNGFYIDRIAALVPPSVSLTNLQVAPLQESIGVNDFIFNTGKISVSGVSMDPTELETFSRAIKNIPGVQAAAMKNYLYKAELLAATFIIEITIEG